MVENLAFAALANPTRRRLLEILVQGPRTAGELAQEFELSRPAVSEHLGILRQAELVQDTPNGRKRHYQLSRQKFQEFNDWLEPFRQYWGKRLHVLGEVLDDIKEPKT